MASKYSMNDRPSWPRRAIVTAGEPYGNLGYLSVADWMPAELIH